MIFRRLALVAVLFAPLTASAADFPLTYSVEEKPLKAAIAGTQLIFTLHRDAGCADPAVNTYGVNIEDVTFLSKLKMFTPKNDAKIPNSVELHHTLIGITATGNLFLKITGTGITPVGGACQPQAAQARTLVPAVTAVIRMQLNTNSPARWGFETPGSIGLGDPADIVSVDESAEAFLLGLNQTSGARYSCALRFVAKNTSNDGGGVQIVPVFGIDVCTVCMNPYPGCL